MGVGEDVAGRLEGMGCAEGLDREAIVSECGAIELSGPESFRACDGASCPVPSAPPSSKRVVNFLVVFVIALRFRNRIGRGTEGYNGY